MFDPPRRMVPDVKNPVMSYFRAHGISEVSEGLTPLTLTGSVSGSGGHADGRFLEEPSAPGPAGRTGSHQIGRRDLGSIRGPGDALHSWLKPSVGRSAPARVRSGGDSDHPGIADMCIAAGSTGQDDDLALFARSPYGGAHS